MTFVCSKGLGLKQQLSSLVTEELLTQETYQEAQIPKLQRHFVLVIIYQCAYVLHNSTVGIKECQSKFNRKSLRLPMPCDYWC